MQYGQEIPQAAVDTLAIGDELERGHDVAMPETRGNGDGPLEARLFCKGSGIDEDAVIEGLGTCIGVDDLGIGIGRGAH